MNAIVRIRRAANENLYRLSLHANEEMSADWLSAADIEAVLSSGAIRQRFRNDPRGTRYEVVGKAVDGRAVGVVCRSLPSGTLLIVTAYAL